MRNSTITCLLQHSQSSSTKARTIRLCFLMLLSVLHSSLLAESATENTTVFSQQLNQAITQDAIRIMGGMQNLAVKRTAPVRYRLLTMNIIHADTLHQVMKMISESTQLDIRPANRIMQPTDDINTAVNGFFSPKSNLAVVITTQKNMLDIARKLSLRPVYIKALKADAATCFFAPSVDWRRIIQNALIYIRDDLSVDMINTCLHEEIIQSFGIFNDAESSDYFSFDNRVVPKTITRYDRLLLSTLYHPDIAPGTPVFQVIEKFNQRLLDTQQWQITLIDD